MDVEALRRELEELPQEPVSRRHPRHWLFRLKRGADFLGHARPEAARFFRRANPYPRPFRHEMLETEDGVSIASWYGPQNDAADFGLVIVPGMFSTKDDTVHKRRAIRIHREWKIPVICIDSRAFGESTGISTAGWKESHDVIAAVEFLKSHGVERVGVLAESLGGAAALNAMAHDHATGRHAISGTLCFSAFVDARDAVEYISTKPPRDHPFRPQWEGFRRLLRYRSMGGYEDFRTYLADAAKVNGLQSLDELYDLANPKWKVSMMQAPTLLVHASDDPVVPVRHARRMERYSRDDPHIQVIVTSWGGHTGFEAMDPTWFWAVVTRFYGELAKTEFTALG